MNHRSFSFLALIAIALCGFWSNASATAYHVAATGGLDANSGSAAAPFLTIQRAATFMNPGDTCYVHAGTYREWVKPPRGGTSESARIVYKAVRGDMVSIKGSERVTTWTLVSGNVYSATFPDSYFGTLNPYNVNIGGEWFAYGGQYHLGEVYFDGAVYTEVTALANVTSTAKTWFTSRSGTTTTITANFGGANPNTGLAEINVRQTVFGPTATGIKYITVDGFTMSHAACQWSPPASNQQGLLSTFHGAYWIIQNCHITDAKCVGIQNGSSGNYQGVTYATDGHSIARKNLIERCGQAGINGWGEWTAGLIEDNLIQDINFQKHFGGWETAGIKVHASVDLIIRRNVIRRVYSGGNASHFGIWIDWANQGSRITGNVIYQMDQSVMLHEMDHGPQLVDNNVLVGPPGVWGGGCQDMSEYSVFVHNLFVTAAFAWAMTDSRGSAYYTPHTTNQAGSATHTTTDTKVYNNIFVQTGSSTVETSPRAACDYNVLYQQAAKSSWADANSIVNSSFVANFQALSLLNGVEISFTANTAPRDVLCPLITKAFIGNSTMTKQGIENPDGTPITIDKDIMGNARNTTHPSAGPFEPVVSGVNRFRLTVGPDSGTSLPTNIAYMEPVAAQILPTFGVSCNRQIASINGMANSTIRIMNLKGSMATTISLGATGTASFKLPAKGVYLFTAKNGTNKSAQRVVAW